MQSQQIKFALTEDPKMLTAYFRIRHERYAQEMGAEPPNSDGLECDEIDRNGYCQYVVVLQNSKVIGGCRLVDKRQTRLPVEDFLFPEHLQIPVDSAEVSRYTVARDVEFTSRESVELLREFNYFLEICRVHLGYTAIFANIRKPCLRLQKLADPNTLIEKIGEENFHQGAGVLVPVRMSHRRTAAPAEVRMYLAT